MMSKLIILLIQDPTMNDVRDKILYSSNHHETKKF